MLNAYNVQIQLTIYVHTTYNDSYTTITYTLNTYKVVMKNKKLLNSRYGSEFHQCNGFLSKMTF